MHKLVLIGLLAVVIGCAPATEQKEKIYDYPISVVEINQVHLTDSFWLPMIKTVQNTTIQFGFDKCEKEGRMENFLIAGGKMEGKTRGLMPFDDTDVYKIIEGASNTLISAPDKALDAYLDSVISIIKVGQEEDGYITTWHTIDPNHPPATWVKPGKRWESEISSHELYNAGHLYEAAAVHYTATGKRNLLDIALKNADLLVNTFGPGKIEAPPGHQIVETGLIKLYRITKDQKYLGLAKFFLDVRGDSTSHPLYGAYNQDHLPVTKQDEAVGHAVRAVYMYAGMTDVAALYQDPSYLQAVKTLWENVVQKKLYLTGGIGARHEGESFGDNYELPNLTAYNETCASIGDVYWNQRMFLLTGDSKYYDIIERTLYNGLISGISLDGDEFFYPNPLEADGKYGFNQGAKTRSSWFDCSCCPTNLIRFIPSMPNLIYSTQKDTLYVNLYASNHASMNVGGSDIEVSQNTNYPWDGAVAFTVNSDQPSIFTIKLRVPGWAQGDVTPGTLYHYKENVPKPIQIKVNDEMLSAKVEHGYFIITKEWKSGDQIALDFSMDIKRVVTSNRIEADKGLVALEYGPLVYCVEGVDNKDIDKLVLPDDLVLSVGRKNNLLNGVNVIIGTTNQFMKVTAIPYYAWANRGETKMKVWLPVK